MNKNKIWQVCSRAGFAFILAGNDPNNMDDEEGLYLENIDEFINDEDRIVS